MSKAKRYDDFVILDGNMIPDDMHVEFIDCFRLLLDNNYKDLEKDICDAFGLKTIPYRCDDEIVEGILSINLKKQEKKYTNYNYYQSHACCLLNTVKEIFNEGLYDIISKDASQRGVFAHILKYFILDFWHLSSIYAHEFNKEDKYFCGKRQYEYFMEIHQTLRYTLYGIGTVNANAGIAVIRQLLEIRLRQAFGVYSYINSEGSIKPLNMSLLFGVLKKYESDISFPFKLSSIEKIYGWANMYIHSALREPSWIPYFLEKFLKPLSFGEPPTERGYNMCSGIKTNQKTIEKIHQDLKEKEPDMEILTSSKYECVIRN